jgi:hypothetical protein
MGMMTLFKFEYNNNARYTTVATNGGKDDNQGEGEHGKNN